MTTATATLATRAAVSEGFDLKQSLTLRVIAAALLCFLAAAAFALLSTNRELRRANEKLADIVNRQLSVQLFRIDTNLDTPARFPDWEPVIGSVQAEGRCVRLRTLDGRVGRSSCVGVDAGDDAPPAWFAALGAALLPRQAEMTRLVAYHGKAYGTLVIATDSGILLAALWKDVSGLLGLTALLVVAICALQYVAIGRALRPARDIMAGLDRLSCGDLSCRLPDFRLIEFRRISEVFNNLAVSLDRMTRERTALAVRLVDRHEAERSHLARELHDELAQSLSAISAAAASIRTTAEVECPALVGEADQLLQTSIATMKSLRRTLQMLRPPEIADFGLAASLLSLTRAQERTALGKLHIALRLDGDLEAVPPAAALHIYRIVQEGLTNIGKHANASRALVALDVRPQVSGAAGRSPRTLALTIEDDGDVSANVSNEADGTGFGLVGMRERAAALGGRLDVVRLDRGFRLEAIIPLGVDAEAAS